MYLSNFFNKAFDKYTVKKGLSPIIEICDIITNRDPQLLQIMVADWRSPKEDFVYLFTRIKGYQQMNLVLAEEDVDEMGDVSLWCRYLDEKWKRINVCIADIDIGDDAYVLFPIVINQLAELVSLAKKIEQKIALGKEV